MTTCTVLGVNFGTHDSAASLIVDGRVVAAAEEERFSRIKQTKAFPERAVQWCLEVSGMRVADVDRIAYFVDPRLQLLLPVMNLRHAFPQSLGSLGSDFAKFLQRRMSLRETQSRLVPVTVVPLRHHTAHAASALFAAPFDDATVVTLDGRGEYETTCVFDGRKGRLHRKHSVTYPHSIGYFYSMLTRYLGFRPQRDEYKIMGLAAHGGPDLLPAMRRLLTVDPNEGTVRLDLRYFDHHRRPSARRRLFSDQMIASFGPPRIDEELDDRHRAIAFAAQAVLEEAVLGYVSFARKITLNPRLCMAGGVALNARANQKVIESGWFEDVFIQPAASDAGTSLGGAWLASAPPAPTSSAYSTLLGPEFSDVEIESALAEARASGALPRSEFAVARVDDRYRQVARLLAAGGVIGWFQGRMEFGPRALGSRSVLASPVDPGMTARVNALIKQREEFRPLAPVVLAEEASNYFDLHEAGYKVYPYMLATARAKPSHAARIPAAIHVDGTARLQLADEETYPELHRLLVEFKRVTEIPVLINTSFNGPDEPIVCTPADAIRSFLRIKLDALVLGDYLVTTYPTAAGHGS